MDMATLGTNIKNAIASKLSTKQDKLVSGTNLKTINNQSLLGSENINIEATGGLTKQDAIKISLILG